jgi:hypothetical protein
MPAPLPREKLELDGEFTRADLIFALEGINWADGRTRTATLKVDRDVVEFLARTLRHRHAARPVR